MTETILTGETKMSKRVHYLTLALIAMEYIVMAVFFCKWRKFTRERLVALCKQYAGTELEDRYKAILDRFDS